MPKEFQATSLKEFSEKLQQKEPSLKPKEEKDAKGNTHFKMEVPVKKPGILVK